MSNNIITVTRPNLTPEERAKRMKEIREATIRLVIATDIAKAKRKKNK